MKSFKLQFYNVFLSRPSHWDDLFDDGYIRHMALNGLISSRSNCMFKRTNIVQRVAVGALTPHCKAQCRTQGKKKTNWELGMKSKTRRLRSALTIVIQEYGDRNGLNRPQSASDARADDDRRANRPTPTNGFCHSAILRPITPYNVWFFWVSRHRSIILVKKMETFSGRFWEIPGNVLKLELLKMFIDHKNTSVFFQAVSGMSSWSFSYRWTQYQCEKKQLQSISSSRF